MKRGFSLVELSIVLVILGLLVGGILSGQSLIRASELRSVTAEYQKYSGAMNAFRDKYFMLPGDMTNAGSFGWKDAANVVIPPTSGNGDGQISPTTTATTDEFSLFWVELSNAGLIEGSYTLAPLATCCYATINSPKPKLNNGIWNVLYYGTQTAASTTYYENNYGNVLLIGGTTNASTPGGVLKSEEAWNIDTKIDDGKPQTGLVSTYEYQASATPGAGCGNAAASTSATAVTGYDLTNVSPTACALIFKTGY